MKSLMREALVDLMKRSNPRNRKTVVRLIEGKASEDGAALIKESLAFIEPDGETVRDVELLAARTCDFGHVLDQSTNLVGVCETCGSLTCSADCGFTCVACGAACCRRHVSLYTDGECYCWRCRPRKWAKSLLQLSKKGVKHALGW